MYIGLFAPRGPSCELDGDVLRVRMGKLGSADIPAARIARLSRMIWPWWAGLGVRIAKRAVAFVAQSGTCVLIEFDGELEVRAPMGWRTRQVVVRVDDPDGLMAALHAARNRAMAEPGEPPPPADG
jgi:hypothetical protein